MDNIKTSPPGPFLKFVPISASSISGVCQMPLLHPFRPNLIWITVVQPGPFLTTPIIDSDKTQNRGGFRNLENKNRGGF